VFLCRPIAATIGAQGNAKGAALSFPNDNRPPE
jgi:hypothetical protein